MQKRFYLLLGVLLLAIVISGCSAPRGGEEPREFNFRTGSEGLVLQFPEGTPDRIFENDQQIKFTVEIQNRGAYPQFDEIGGLNGFIWVGGFDKSVIDLQPEQRQLDERALEGKSEINREGGYWAAVISGRAFNLPSGTPYYRTPMIVTATYNYETVASADICVDPEPRSPYVREKVCQITDFSNVVMSGSQGAPIAVTSIEEDATSTALLFRIYVSNVGGGLLINENDISFDPNRGYDWDELNQVRIADVAVGNIPMTECRPGIGEYLELRNNRGVIFCRLATAGLDNAYRAPLNVRLAYGYASSVTRDIEVHREINY